MAGSAPADWEDLGARTFSGVAIAIVSLAALLAGGVWFQMLAVFATAVMVWELWMMIRPDMPERGMMMAALSASVLSGLLVAEIWAIVPLLFFTPVIGALSAQRERRTFFLFALGIELAGAGMIHARQEYGWIWLLWLILVVIGTDVAGYFAGRRFGGAKFWPSLSPKKTWSGTMAGWGAAALIGALFAALTDANALLIVISVAVSLASQMGDIAESALKRRMGVKDSSALIPGHGGLFDRFDALLGAVLFALALVVLGVPGVAF